MPSGRLAGALAVLALVLGVSACGGGDGDATADRSPRATPSPRGDEGVTTPDEVDPVQVRIVRAWADTLRHGDVRAAARYFAIPSRVSNGTQPILLATRAEAVFFNQTLPCGAELIDTEPAPHGFLIATFRLTERPGAGSCGSGTGETARTAFRVRDDHITDWLRVEDVASAPETLS